MMIKNVATEKNSKWGIASFVAENPSDAVLAIVAVLIAANFFLMQLPTRATLNGDVSLYLESAQLILKGKIPYRDFWDINPPLVMYLSVIPVFLADVFGVSIIAIMNTLVVALLLFAAGQLALAGRERRMQDRILLIIGFFLGNWVTAVPHQFGQREHLFALVLVPYLFLRWSDLGERHSKLMGFDLFLVSLMACLKPSFFILLSASELAYFWRKRSIKPTEAIMIFLPVILYALLLVSLPIQVQTVFWTEHIPFILRRYSSYDDTWFALFKDWAWYLLSFFLLSLINFKEIKNSSSENNRLLSSFGVMTVLALLAAVSPKKAWAYHLIVGEFLFFMLGFLILGRLLNSQRIGALQKVGQCVVLAAILGAPYRLSYNSILRGPDQLMAAHETRFIDSILKLVPANSEVAIFSTEPPMIYPAIFNHKLWPGTRYLFFYPIQFYNNTSERRKLLQKRYPEYDDLEAGEKVFVNEVRDDLTSRRPRLVYFPIDGSIQPPGFDILKYAESVGWLNAIKGQYQLISSNEFGTVFVLKP